MAFSKTMCHQCRCVCLCRTTIASLRSFSETSKNWVFSYRNLLKYINFRVCIEYIRKDTVNAILGGMHGFAKVIANPTTERKLYHNVVFVWTQNLPVSCLLISMVLLHQATKLDKTYSLIYIIHHLHYLWFCKISVANCFIYKFVRG